MKIIDFGTSRRIGKEEKIKVKMGTPYYVAPEVLLENYDRKCDIWSIGVILYILLCGYPPFNGSTDEKILERIKTKDVKFPDLEWEHVSKEVKDLIVQMLSKDPEKRPTAQEVLKNPWFNQAKPQLSQEQQQSILKNLEGFSRNNKIQNALRYYMVNYMEMNQEKNDLLTSFRAIDKDNNGILTKDEITEFMLKNSSSFNDLTPEELFSKLDLDISENIDYNEFLLAIFDFKKHLNDELIQKLFKLIDANGDGKISQEELGKFFHFNNAQKEFLVELMNQADEDKDGVISMEEFRKTLLN